MFGYFKNRRRRALIGNPMPEAWVEYLATHVHQFRHLSNSQQQTLQARVRILVAEKHWEGCNGLQVTDQMRVTIAGQASLMLLGAAPNYVFDGVKTILIYPHSFRRKTQNGWIIDEESHRAGEAWQGGPIVLSWSDVLYGNEHPHAGHNLVIHEFAHHVDGIDGAMGGSPPLPTRKLRQRWKIVFNREYERLCEAVEEGQRSLFDPYGASNKAEFFAVSTELFFELPLDFRARCPQYYELLVALFQVAPHEWAE